MTTNDHRSDELPSFRYHPDPIATGSIRPSDEAVCRRCSRNRGFIYVGPV
ncbi:MAG: CbrC family protein [bacterium]|nr:CbrC family protein [bacterium]